MSLPDRAVALAPRSLRRGAGPSATADLARLSIVTMNVWFGTHYQRLRWADLFDQLEHMSADLIAFQEVTSAFVRQLAKQPWTADYQWIDDGGPNGGGYGVGILSRVAIDRAWLVELPSEMRRTLLSVEVRAGEQPFTLATTHLESYRHNVESRGEQLVVIQEALTSARQGVLCGDLNFCASWQAENDRLDPRYQDLWSTLRPGEPGFTVDTRINRMLGGAAKPPVRFDRLLLFSEGEIWRGETIELVGDEPLPGLPTVYPSDHFGLVATVGR